jgi:hypothetical protein
MDDKLLVCSRCKTTSKAEDWKLGPPTKEITEEATLTCPICQTVMAISAAVRNAVQGGADAMMAPAGVPGIKPPGGPAAPGTTNIPPPAGGGGGVGGQGESVKVCGCAMCGAEWVGRLVDSCPECDQSDGIVEVQKTVPERIQDAFTQAEAGVPLDRVMEMLLGQKNAPRQEEASAVWEGTLAEFNTKLQELVSKLGLTLDLGDLSDELLSSGSLKIKGNTLKLNCEKAVKAIGKFVSDNDLHLDTGAPPEVHSVLPEMEEPPLPLDDMEPAMDLPDEDPMGPGLDGPKPGPRPGPMPGPGGPMDKPGGLPGPMSKREPPMDGSPLDTAARIANDLGNHDAGMDGKKDDSEIIAKAVQLYFV